VENLEFNKIFKKKKKYSEQDILDVAKEFCFSIADNIKDNNLITLTLKENTTPSWVFKLVTKKYSKQLKFILKWSEFES